MRYVSFKVHKLSKHELTEFPHVRLTPRRLRDLIDLLASTFAHHSIQCAGYEVDSFDALGHLVEATGSKYTSTLRLTGNEPGRAVVELSGHGASLYIDDVDNTLLSGVSRKVHDLVSQRPFWISLFPSTSWRSTMLAASVAVVLVLAVALGISRAFAVDYSLAVGSLYLVWLAYCATGLYLDIAAHSRIQMIENASF
jgi:hypothetical protein